MQAARKRSASLPSLPSLPVHFTTSGFGVLWDKFSTTELQIKWPVEIRKLRYSAKPPCSCTVCRSTTITSTKRSALKYRGNAISRSHEGILSIHISPPVSISGNPPRRPARQQLHPRCLHQGGRDRRTIWFPSLHPDCSRSYNYGIL